MSFVRNVRVMRRRQIILLNRFNSTQVNKEWKGVVGLEIHAQINSTSKLFSGSANSATASVNSCVSLFDAAIPGTLPVLNRRCVELAVLTSLAFKCTINEVSMFDRKHYFYADMPAGYQITQQRSPIAKDGILEFRVFTPGVHKQPYKKSSRIKQIQLEQDSGKSLHDSKANNSLVDLNRAGAPLMELVFEPDLEDGEEAAALVKEIILILRMLNSCTCKLEAGALRVDANVSVHREGEPLGVRTEIKNIGSVRGVAGAVKYEIDRQIKLKSSGGTVVNQTRAWDMESKSTILMRDKEVVQDYRFMPEPNLPPLRLDMFGQSNDLVNVPELKSQIPELPEDTRNKLMETWNLRQEHSTLIVNEPILLYYFLDLVVNTKRNPTRVAIVLIIDLLWVLNKYNIELEECPVTSHCLGELIDLLLNRSISSKTVRKVLLIMVTEKRNDPTNIVMENKLTMIDNDEYVTKVCLKIINGNEKLFTNFKNGKKKLFKKIMALIDKEARGTIDMSAAANKIQEMAKK